MSEKYRVVLTCWDYGKPNEPYADSIPDLFDSRVAAKTAVSKCVADELKTLNEGRKPVAVKDSDGNVVCHDYDFRSDENGDHDNVIRFWDGDDCQEVTHYDVYPIWFYPMRDCSISELHHCDYRGFAVYADYNDNRFKIKRNDVTLEMKPSLQTALHCIDEFSLVLELYNSQKLNYVPATYVSVWDTGAELLFPCKVNLETREVFDVELDPDALDGVEVFQGEKVCLWEGKEYPLFAESDARPNDTCFWCNSNDSLDAPVIANDKVSLSDQILSASPHTTEPQQVANENAKQPEREI